MNLNPQEQELINRLHQQYPRSASIGDLEVEFRNNVIDRQVDEIMSGARNRAAHYNDRLMVPSDAELEYRSRNLNPLAEGLTKQPRPNPTPPTTPPPSSPTVRTSSATPPPTPRTSGLGVGNGMQAMPATAAPRAPVGSNPTPGTLPSGIPGPAGSLLYPGIGAGITFGSRLIAGQPIGQAGFGAAGTFGGTVVGGIVGSAFGPVGTFVGGTVGGFLGGIAADLIYNAAFSPSAEAPKGLSDPKTGPTPFQGGQNPNVGYSIRFRVRQTENYFGTIYTSEFENQIGAFFKINAIFVATRSGRTSLFANCNGFNSPTSGGGDIELYGQTANITLEVLSLVIHRNDGLPDTDGNPPPLSVPDDKRLPESVAHPGNTNYAPPSALPLPLVALGGRTGSNAATPAPNNYAPGGTAPRSNGTPTRPLIPSGVPANSPHPSNSPIPISSLPSVASPSSPNSTGAPTSVGVGAPNKSPFTFKSDGSYEIITPGNPLTTGNPQTNPSDVSYPPTGFQPLILQPNPLTANPIESRNFTSRPSPDTATPSGIPQPTKTPVTPDATKEIPTAPPPTPTPDLTEQIQKEIEKLKKQQEDQLVPVMLLLTGLTAALAPIANNTTPQAIQTAAAAGTCQTLQPGGCMTPLANNAAAAANNSASNGTAISGIMAFLQALQAAFLVPIKAGVELVNTKLGPLMAGANGIGGALSRVSSSMGIDRALNLIAIAANLHNAMMLSANLKITLLEVLSSVGNATGLLQTPDGDNVDLNAVFNQGVESFMVLLLGTENYAGLKVGLRKYSSIYRAANNVLSNTGNMFSSIGNGIEVIGERTGKIGNAIRAAGMVRENAYQWMSEKMTVHTSKFMTFQTQVGGVTEVLETINEIAESTIEGQQSYTEAIKASTEFKKVLAEGSTQEAKDAENLAIKAEADKIKENLSKDPTGEKDSGYLSFLTD